MLKKCVDSIKSFFKKRSDKGHFSRWLDRWEKYNCSFRRITPVLDYTHTVTVIATFFFANINLRHITSTRYFFFKYVQMWFKWQTKTKSGGKDREKKWNRKRKKVNKIYKHSIKWWKYARESKLSFRSHLLVNSIDKVWSILSTR